MSPGMAARWALVCALLIGGSIGGSTARADKRPVAVINLSDDEATRQLAGELDVELANHPDLRALPSTIAAALVEYSDEDAPRIAEATRHLRNAEEELGKLRASAAAKEALDGERELWLVSPAQARKLYADLALVFGQARLDDDPKEAAAALALTHQLDPQRVLDPGFYPPDLRDAYKAASTQVAGTATLAIHGTGTVWIDAQELGAAPGTFPVTAGAHVAWLTGADRETRGASVMVEPGRETTLEIPDAPASERQKLQRARLMLARATDAFTRATAMRRLAAIADVHDAVLLSTSNGKVIVQTWRDRAPGFSALRERGKDPAIELLGPLTPPKVAIQVEPPPKVLPPLVIPHWYERTSVRAGIVIGVISAIVGGVMWARSGPNSILPDRNITVDNGALGR